MSKIDDVCKQIGNNFRHRGEKNYIRILDTPHVWGMKFGREIMPGAYVRTKEFERAIAEIVQKSRYRCDVASLNCPDPYWSRLLLDAIDTTLSDQHRDTQIQFRFLFGQTPLCAISDPENYKLLKDNIIRLVNQRSHAWKTKPEIWIGRFYRLTSAGIHMLVQNTLGEDKTTGNDKLTWNHAKIIAADGAEALVGGHNLNIDLFASYPPVHDVSIVVHGDAAYGAQLYLNKMWECKTDLLTKEHLDFSELRWKNSDDDAAPAPMPADPLSEKKCAAYMAQRHSELWDLHSSRRQKNPSVSLSNVTSNAEAGANAGRANGIAAEDLRALDDLQLAVFDERKQYVEYDGLDDYRKTTCMLSIGKYWDGPSKQDNYKNASGAMKKELILNAKYSISMSQMDLISAWKVHWSDHEVCHWVMEALLANKKLIVRVVVSPLDAGAGAEGDQYSFGSGAKRTFDLIEYYFKHDIDDSPLSAEKVAAGTDALKRLHIAPFYFTDLVNEGQTIEGETYQWPDLDSEGYTSTLKQRPLGEQAPMNGVIGNIPYSLKQGSGMVFDSVKSAPGNHAKIMLVDDEAYLVGSDNLYPGFLSEFNYLIEGESAVNNLCESYWKPLWNYSHRHCVNPSCKNTSADNQ